MHSLHCYRNSYPPPPPPTPFCTASYGNRQGDIMKPLPFFYFIKSSALDIVSFFAAIFLWCGAPHVSGDPAGPIVGALDVNQAIGFLKCYTLTATSIKCQRHLTQCLGEGGKLQ